MPKVTTNNVKLFYTEETVPGEIPGNPSFEIFPFTNGLPDFNYTTELSEAITGERGRRDLIVVGAEVTASINFEFSYSTHARFLTDVLRSPTTSPYKNGNESPVTYTFLKLVTEGPNRYFYYYTGCVVKSIQLDLAAGSRISGAMALIGRSEDTSTEVSGSSYGSIPSDFATLSSSQVTNITLGGNSYCATNATISFENNSTAANCVGSLGASGVSDFGFDATIDTEIYFEQLVEYLKFRNSSSFAASIAIDDGSAEMVIEFPKCKYEQFNVPIGTKDQYLLLPTTIRALHDTTEDCSVKISTSSALDSWLLSSGSWDDTGYWDDAATWNDGTIACCDFTQCSSLLTSDNV